MIRIKAGLPVRVHPVRDEHYHADFNASDAARVLALVRADLTDGVAGQDGAVSLSQDAPAKPASGL